jgi:threonine/homoserine/homoserine lactone efflux protein
MNHDFLIKGIIFGFIIAATIGPISILCIRKTFEFGRFSGLFSGLGAALADTIYGIIAACGLTLITDLMFAGQFWLRLIGGIFLVYLGIKTFFSKPELNSNKVTHKSLFNDFFTTFLLTMINPTTIISFLAIFAGLGLADAGGDYVKALWLVLGVFLGSTFWWIILSEGITLFRHKINSDTMIWINRSAGIVIAGFGTVSAISIYY